LFSNAPKAVHIRIFCKFTNSGTALAPFGSELNIRSIQARTSPSQVQLADIPTNQTSYEK